MNNKLRHLWPKTKRERDPRYLGVTAGHCLHQIARRQSPAAHVSAGRSIEALAYAVHRNVHHRPHPLGVLLAEPQEAHLPHRHKRRQHLQFRLHLFTPDPNKYAFHVLIQSKSKEKLLTSCSAPFRVPPMPLDMISMVAAFATMHGNIFAQRFWYEKFASQD